MIDALMIWRIDLDESDEVHAALRRSGFGSAAIDTMADIAVAAAKDRRPSLS